MSTKKLINSVSQIACDALEGLLLTNTNLKRIGNLNIVCRNDILTYKNEFVTLISGGGSGHEPAHGGFIGDGMLSAAVLGNVFASPSVSTILAALRTCGGARGALLIVKNYTGDRLNFGMAMELAKQEGIECMMVIVEDDCALPEGKGITGGRGVAGTIFVHKIAGAVAASGASLLDVYRHACQAAKSVGSLGVALNVCAVPGAPVSQRLSDPSIFEVGMGIHGEPGREKRQLPSTGAADYVADIMVAGILGDNGSISPRLKLVPGSTIAILLNNLGALAVIDMYIVAKRVIINLKNRGFVPVRVFVGSFMTSLDMNGISLSIFRLDSSELPDNFLKFLDFPTSASAWVPSSSLEEYDDSVIPYNESQFKKAINGGVSCPLALDIVQAVCKQLIQIEPKLTEFDSICGDGDCGLTFKAGAECVLVAISSNGNITDDSAIFCDGIADAVSSSMGGTSGVLLEIFFRAMATSLSKPDQISADQPILTNNWTRACRAGLDAMMLYGGATSGMRTLLDALIPAVEKLELNGSVEEAAQSAAKGMESTKVMESLAGRSNYVNAERMTGIPDPGAFAVAETFSVIAAIVK